MSEHIPGFVGGRQTRGHFRRILAALLLGLAPLLSGCLVIEKKTLVLVLPPDSKEMRLYYVFEGLSVLADDPQSSPENAANQLDALKADNLNFFVSGLGPGPDDPLLRHFRFGPTRFFLDPGRTRKLCAERRAAVVDRQRFANYLNRLVTDSLRRDLGNWTEDQLLEQLKEARKSLRDPEARRNAAVYGMGPLLKVAQGLADIAAQFDRESVGRLRDRADKGFAWLRFGPEAVRVVVPVTPACARRVLGDPETNRWLKEMRSFVTPLGLAADDEGLAIVLGKKGQPIRLTYTDERGHVAGQESFLIQKARWSGPLFFATRNADAGRLIEQFVARAGEDKVKRPGAVPEPAPDAVALREERKRLEGTWEAVSSAQDGQTRELPGGRAMRLVIDGDAYTVQAGRTPREKGAVRLDPARIPKALDLTPGEVSLGEPSWLAIYERTRDQLRLCVAEQGQPRPDRFSSTPGSKRALLTFRLVSARREAHVLQKELRRLEGDWRLVTVVHPAGRVRKPVGKGARVAIRGDTYTGGDAAPASWVLRLDPNDPPALDAVAPGADPNKQTYRGLYELQGDELRWCRAAPGRPRPDDFVAGGAGGNQILTLRRVKPGEDARRDGKKELQRLEGDWRVITIESAGKRVKRPVGKSTRVSIRGATYTVGEDFLPWVLALDPDDDPPALDITPAGPQKGAPCLGLYELQGDELRWCRAAPGRPRPDEFAAGGPGGCQILTLRRVKPGEDGKEELKRLQGTWEIISQDAQKIQWPAGTGMRVTIRGNAYIVGDAVKSPWALKIDPIESTMDVTTGGETKLGIYLLKGDELLWCRASPGRPRPDEFLAGGREGWQLLTLRRVKTKR